MDLYDFITGLRIFVTLIGVIGFVWILMKATVYWERYNTPEKCLMSYVILSAYGMVLTTADAIVIREPVTVQSFAFLFATGFLLGGLWLARGTHIRIDQRSRRDKGWDPHDPSMDHHLPHPHLPKKHRR